MINVILKYDNFFFFQISNEEKSNLLNKLSSCTKEMKTFNVESSNYYKVNNGRVKFYKIALPMSIKEDNVNDFVINNFSIWTLYY